MNYVPYSILFLLSIIISFWSGQSYQSKECSTTLEAPQPTIKLLGLLGQARCFARSLYGTGITQAIVLPSDNQSHMGIALFGATFCE